jgi:hypothetical protein
MVIGGFAMGAVHGVEHQGHHELDAAVQAILADRARNESKGRARGRGWASWCGLARRFGRFFHRLYDTHFKGSVNWSRLQS